METQKLLTVITVLSFVGILGVGAAFVYLLTSKSKGKVALPEVFLLNTSSFGAYYQLEADKTEISAGERVNLMVKLTTSGQEFNSAQAILEWDNSDFRFVGSQGLLQNKEGFPAGFNDTYLQGTTNYRNMVHSVTPGDPYMQLTANTPTDSFRVVLEAKATVKNGAVVRLSPQEGNLSVTFNEGDTDGDGSDDFVDALDQTLESGAATEVVFSLAGDTAGCTSNSDCATNMVCNNGICANPPGPAREGEACGGIAGILCAEGLYCDYIGDGADASGTCKREIVTTSPDICEATFALAPFKQCGENPCTNDTDCAGSLVCAPNGYCSMPEYVQNCNPENPTTTCCQAPPDELACGEDGCTNDDDCAGLLVCAPNGYCSMPEYVGSCNPTNPTTSCCTAPPQEYMCVDLTPENPNPGRGDAITFTCTADGNAASHARFRVRYNNETVSGPSDFIALNGSKQATWTYTVGGSANEGSYLVQCQVCKSAAENDCRAWGQAQ